MNLERLFLADPFNDAHIEKFEEFENNNSLKTKPSLYLKKIRSTYNKEAYLEQQKKSNEIIELLFIEKDNKIKDYCHIHGEKDIKSCRMSFAKLDSTLKRKLLPLATNYAFNALEMQEVFLLVEKEDKNMIDNLTNSSFESLGEEKGELVFLKEKEEIKGRQNENYK